MDCQEKLYGDVLDGGMFWCSGLYIRDYIWSMHLAPEFHTHCHDVSAKQSWIDTIIRGSSGNTSHEL